MQKSILWAIDPFDTDQKITDSAIALLGPLASRLSAIIVPAHVLTPSELNVVTGYSEVADVTPTDSQQPQIERFLKSFVADHRTRLPSLTDPVILSVDSTSLQSAVTSLCDYADSVDAEAIVLSSHGRSGFGRFFLGSFAESLMAQANRPVFVSRPGTQTNGLDRMLIPTDLTDDELPHFREALDYAQRLGMEVQLLHCVSYPVEPLLQSGIYLFSGGWMPIHGPVDEEIEALQKKISLWVSEAKDRGVKASGSIYSQGGGIAETIVRIAKQDRVNLIVMEVQSGPIASALLGSVTREVARHSHCPVMISGFRPEGLSKHRPKKAA